MKTGGFPADAFENLARVEPGHYWFESRNAVIVWAMQRYFPKARTLLEVGCGTGFVLQGLHRAFPHLALSASDALPGGLVTARARVPGAEIFQQDARDLDAAARFDVVCAFDVLEHIVEDTAALQRLHAAAVPGGGLLITVPQHAWLWSGEDEYGQHVRRYSRRELAGRIEEAGFELLHMTSFVTLLLPLMALSRWRSRRASEGPCHAELRPPAAVNALLRQVLTIERQAIRAGISWPAGGSLLAVARRR
jgi:2-polyprenyl-3-methyl-5-hydroxy-6-metoxy-1,4-benzoquinol methylase